MDASANIDNACDEGNTALLAAAKEGHHEVVEILLNADANENVICDEGKTAAAWAAEKDHGKIAFMIKQHSFAKMASNLSVEG